VVARRLSTVVWPSYLAHQSANPLKQIWQDWHGQALGIIRLRRGYWMRVHRVERWDGLDVVQSDSEARQELQK